MPGIMLKYMNESSKIPSVAYEQLWSFPFTNEDSEGKDG